MSEQSLPIACSEEEWEAVIRYAKEHESEFGEPSCHCGSQHLCGAESPEGFLCTEPEGHAGDHVACSARHSLKRWPRQSELAHEFLDLCVTMNRVYAKALGIGQEGAR